MTSFLRLGWSVLFLSSVLAASCAKDVDGFGDSGGGEDGKGGDGGAEPMGSGGAGGAANSSSSASGAGGGAESELVASLSSMTMTMDCKAGNTPGISGVFQAFYDNTKGATSGIAIIKSARITMSLAADSFVWTFAASPSSTFVPAGQTSDATHTAGMGTGMGKGALCDYCGQIWKLDVDWDVGGKTTSGSLAPIPVNCEQ